MPRLKRASFKQKQFARKYIQNKGDATKTALDVYDVKPKNAKQLGHQTVNHPFVQEELKKSLAKYNLNIDTSTEQLARSVQYNLDEGKPSQAVGADLLKFIYKLHDAIPANKNMNLNYSKSEIETKGYKEIKEELTKLNQLTSKIIKEA